jgi:hypothetical protein
MIKALKLWLYRGMLRSTIRVVDFIESQCYQAQTILRGKLSPDTLPSPCQAEGSASDLGLAWRVTKVLLFLLGVVALISFFATLRTVYFITFACLCLGQWVAVFSLVRLIYRKKLSAAPSESARVKILRKQTRPLSNAAEEPPASSIGPFAVASSSSPRRAGGAGESFPGKGNVTERVSSAGCTTGLSGLPFRSAHSPVFGMARTTDREACKDLSPPARHLISRV